MNCRFFINSSEHIIQQIRTCAHCTFNIIDNCKYCKFSKKECISPIIECDNNYYHGCCAEKKGMLK